MPHDVLLDLWGFCEKNLSPSWEAFGIFDPFEVLRCISGAVEDYSCAFAEESRRDLGYAATNDSDTIFLGKLLHQVLNMHWCIYRDCGKLYPKGDSSG